MMRLIKILTPLVAGLSIFSTPAMAQTVPEHGVFVLNSLLFLIGGFSFGIIEFVDTFSQRPDIEEHRSRR